MSKPIVHLYTICWDEADMLGFFFRHYDSWVDRYVIYDDGSTEGHTANTYTFSAYVPSVTLSLDIEGV